MTPESNNTAKNQRRIIERLSHDVPDVQPEDELLPDGLEGLVEWAVDYWRRRG